MRRLASLLLACALLAGSLASTASPASAAGAYLLPAPGGTQLYVTTGNGGLHQGWEYYAWDFTVGKTEFPVAAARGGVVVGAWGGSQDPQDNCYPDGSCWTRANYVLVDHCDGKTAGLYMHLAYGTVNVAVGQRVTIETILGNADNTGWSSGTHLHFQVEQLPPGVDGSCSGPPPASATGSAGWWFRQSVPITFGDFDVLAKTSTGTLGVPVQGQTYTSSNATAAPVVTPPPTAAPTPTPAPSVDLASLLPASIGGIKAKVTPTLTGSVLFDGSPFLNAVKSLSTKLGVPIDGVQEVSSTYAPGTHVTAYRLAGAPQAALLQGWLAGPEAQSGVTLSKVALGGKTVTKWTAASSPNAYIYAHNDVVFIVNAVSQTDSAEAVSKLP